MAERDDLAAEFALGTLDGTEREQAQALYESDAQFAQAVEQWRARLYPLMADAPPVEPPAHAFGDIMRRIAPDSATSNVAQLRRSLARWRGAAITATAIAAALLLVVVTPRPSQQFVSVLQTGDKTPAFIAVVDVERRVIAVRRVGAEAAQNHSYELWALGGGRAKPQSLGIVDAVAHIPTEQLGRVSPDTVFAVSLEPEGGSPTGQPTGPVLFTGKLVAAN